MNLLEELNKPLPEVKIKWIRRMATLLLTPICFIACILFAVLYDSFKTTYDFFIECWKGE